MDINKQIKEGDVLYLNRLKSYCKMNGIKDVDVNQLLSYKIK